MDGYLRNRQIKQNPASYQKNISFGSEGNTFLEIKSNLYQISDTDATSEISIGIDESGRIIGEGTKLKFLGVWEKNRDMYMARYNANADTSELRMSLGYYFLSSPMRPPKQAQPM